jgi:hypothetical protein
MLGLEIQFPGLGKGMIEVRALLSDPEGMFKTDKNGW